MKKTLSLRYAKAFLEAMGESKVQVLLQKQEEIEIIFCQRDFVEFLHNPFINPSSKSKAFLDILKIEGKEICRAIDVVAMAGRLELFPEIINEIAEIFSSREQTYQAVFYSQEKTSSQMLEQIGKILSLKLGSKIDVVEKLWQKDGAKCVIEELDLEVSFSKELFVSGLQKYILDTFRKGV